MLRFFPNAALTGFSAYLDHRSGHGRASFLPSPVPLAHSPQRGSPVSTKAAGLLSGETGPTKTIERVWIKFYISCLAGQPRPGFDSARFSLILLVSPLGLERGLGHRQTRDPDWLASQGFQVVLEREVTSRSATNS